LCGGAGGLIQSVDSDLSLVFSSQSTVFLAKTNADPKSFAWTAAPQQKRVLAGRQMRKRGLTATVI
jgi:hypothetical protein